MNLFRKILSRVRALLQKQTLDEEMDKEMQGHIEMRTRANMEAGMSLDEARRAALRHFGWTESLKETCREQRGVSWIENFVRDLRYALRMLFNNPTFTSVAVLTLALGIGATTTIFSVVNGVLLRPLPYVKPEHLVRVYSEFPTFPNGGLRRFAVSGPEFLDLQRDTKSWDSLDVWLKSGANVAGKGEPTRVTAASVTGGLLATLGVSPAQGRLITPADDNPGAPLVTDISFGLWQRAFGGDRDIVGQEILLNGRKCAVIGVMPKGFQFPPGETDSTEVWTPLQINPADPGARGAHSYWLLGRLKPEVTLAQAQTELALFVKRSVETSSAGGHNFDPHEHTIVSYGLQDEVVRAVKPALRMLLGAVCLVLLIACGNVANLLLARAEARQREIAIRGALGASPWRLTVQFVTEGIVLSSLAALVGFLLAYAGLALVKGTGDASVPRASEIGFDAYVFLFALATSIATGVVFGLAPLMRVVRQKVYDALKSAAASTTSATSTQRFRQGLVVSELALALMLLIGTGLMVRAFWKLREVNPGFNTRKVVTGLVALPEAAYRDPQAIVSFWTRLEQRLNALPGIQNAAFVSGLPPAHSDVNWSTEIEGFTPVPGGPIQSVEFYQIVSKDYFKTMGIQLIEGRSFDQRDGTETPNVAIVNQTMARTFWGNQSPVGRRIRPDFAGPWCTVVGVVADVKNAGLEKPTGTELYLPFNQVHAHADGKTRSLQIVFRSTGNPLAVVSSVRGAVNELDPALPMAKVRTMEEVMSATQSRPRFLTLLLTVFSSVALVLAAVGIYGVISYSVAQRTKEFGLRMALGAQPANVLGIVLRRGMFLAGIGVVFGLAGALILTRFLSSLLFGISTTDPMTFTTISLVLAAVALLASYIPARRATQVDPMVALRYE